MNSVKHCTSWRRNCWIGAPDEKDNGDKGYKGTQFDGTKLYIRERLSKASANEKCAVLVEKQSRSFGQPSCVTGK